MEKSKLWIEVATVKRRCHCTRCDALLQKMDNALLIRLWSGVGFYLCNECAKAFNEGLTDLVKRLNKEDE